MWHKQFNFCLIFIGSLAMADYGWEESTINEYESQIPKFEDCVSSPFLWKSKFIEVKISK